jgi:hypothetical protein
MILRVRERTERVSKAHLRPLQHKRRAGFLAGKPAVLAATKDAAANAEYARAPSNLAVGRSRRWRRARKNDVRLLANATIVARPRRRRLVLGVVLMAFAGSPEASRAPASQTAKLD